MTYAWRALTPQLQRSLHLIVQEQANTGNRLARITGRSAEVERRAIIQLLNRGLIRVVSNGRERVARATPDGIALVDKHVVTRIAHRLSSTR